MHALITGGTGLIGKPLVIELLNLGWSVAILTRSKTKAAQRFADVSQPLCSQLSYVSSFSELSKSVQFDAVINLAGENIADHLWTARYKQKIWHSRVQLTLDLSQWIRGCAVPPKVLISGSAMGYYGDHKEAIVYEETKGRPGFAHELCRHWEQAALSTTRYGCRVCCLRIGVVLADDGGYIKKLTPFCKLGSGILFGNGHQWFPWIHRTDLINIILTALNNEAYFSAINAVSLEQSSQKEVAQGIGRRIGQPFWVPMPKWMVKPVMGEMADLFYASVKASPNRLTGFGYQYRFPRLSDALDDLFPINAHASRQT